MPLKAEPKPDDRSRVDPLHGIDPIHRAQPLERATAPNSAFSLSPTGILATVNLRKKHGSLTTRKIRYLYCCITKWGMRIKRALVLPEFTCKQPRAAACLYEKLKS